MKTVSRTLAEFSCALTFEDLPADVVAAAKRILFDSVGCAFGGSESEDVRMALQLAREAGGFEQATLLVSGERTCALQASFLNSLMIRALDFNDIYWRQDPSHPSDIIPAAMACGELANGSGRELLLGIVLGHEIEMRLCEAAFPGIRELGWHHATLTALASPFVAARMLGLDLEETIHAVGISGCHCATFGAITAGRLTKMKNTADPMACRAGVEAALLASRGYDGPEEIFEGREGLAWCIGEKWKWETVTAGLGESWRILDCSMKGAPVEALIHTPLTVTLALREKWGLHPGNVQEIEVRTTRRAVEILSDESKYDPTTRETADHSLPYCIAVAIADGRLTPRELRGERILDPELRPLMKKVKVVALPELEELFPALQPCEVRVRLTDGSERGERMDYPMGDPRNPMTEKQIDQKFEALTEHLLSAQGRQRAKEAIASAESAPTIRELLRELVADGGS